MTPRVQVTQNPHNPEPNTQKTAGEGEHGVGGHVKGREWGALPTLHRRKAQR